MIDVCRSEIDLKQADKFLRRGAELVLDMVEDRVFRVSRNELSALQYGLNFLESGNIKDESSIISKIKSFSPELKERVVKEFLEERLFKFNYNGAIKWRVYEQLFSEDNEFPKKIKLCLLQNNLDLQLIGIEYSIKYSLYDQEFIYSFNLLASRKYDELLVILEKADKNFPAKVLDELSEAAIAVIFDSLLSILNIRRRYYRLNKQISYFSSPEFDIVLSNLNNKKNRALFKLMAHFVILYNRIREVDIEFNTKKIKTLFCLI